MSIALNYMHAIPAAILLQDMDAHQMACKPKFKSRQIFTDIYPQELFMELLPKEVRLWIL